MVLVCGWMRQFETTFDSIQGCEQSLSYIYISFTYFYSHDMSNVFLYLMIPRIIFTIGTFLLSEKKTKSIKTVHFSIGCCHFHSLHCVGQHYYVMILSTNDILTDHEVLEMVISYKRIWPSTSQSNIMFDDIAVSIK